MESIAKDIGRRIKDSLKASGLKQKDLAEALGIADASVSAYVQGDNRMPEESYLILSGLTGKSIDYFFTGKESCSCISEPQTDYSATVTMPVYALAGAGAPCCIDALEPICHICVEKKLDGPNIRVIEIRGSSMEPTLLDGSYVGVDVTDKNVISGKLYAVYLPYEGVVVKRIWIGPELVKIESDNKAAPSHDMSIDRINWDTFIQGRVKWWIVREG